MISEAHSLAPGGDSRGLDHSSICELVSTWAKERKKDKSLTQKKTKNPKKKNVKNNDLLCRFSPSIRPLRRRIQSSFLSLFVFSFFFHSVIIEMRWCRMETTKTI